MPKRKTNAAAWAAPVETEPKKKPAEEVGLGVRVPADLLARLRRCALDLSEQRGERYTVKRLLVEGAETVLARYADRKKAR